MASQVRVLPPPPSCFAPRRFAGLRPARPRSRMPSEALAKEGRTKFYLKHFWHVPPEAPRRFAGLRPAKPRSRMPSEALAKEGQAIAFAPHRTPKQDIPRRLDDGGA